MFEFCVSDRKGVRPFIEEHHYSHSINGCKTSACFAAKDAAQQVVAAALFGGLSTTAWKRYGDVEQDVVELRRMVTLDSCPSNTGSWFISRCLRWLKANTGYKVVVSYADPYFGHTGIQYQASNWKYCGTTPPDTVLETPGGKRYHSRAMRTKYKGELKPFARRLVELNEKGLLRHVTVPGKHIYIYPLVRYYDRLPAVLPYPKPAE